MVADLLQGAHASEFSPGTDEDLLENWVRVLGASAAYLESTGRG